MRMFLISGSVLALAASPAFACPAHKEHNAAVDTSMTVASVVEDGARITVPEAPVSPPASETVDETEE